MGANKPVAPASLLQAGGASRVVGKKSLELWERLWEPKIATLVNVHEHGRTLPLVAVGDNRIGKSKSSVGAHGGHVEITAAMPIRTIRLVLSIAMLAFLAAATPAATEILVSGKAQAVLTKLTVDDALKAAPGLFDNLAAEGKTWIDKGKREAEAEYRKDPSFFADCRVWSFDRNYKILSTVGPYVSVLRTDYSFMGGAHPSTDVDTILWDADTKKRVNVRPFFVETKDNGPAMTALATLIRDAVQGEKGPWNRGGGRSGQRRVAEGDRAVAPEARPAGARALDRAGQERRPERAFFALCGGAVCRRPLHGGGDPMKNKTDDE